MSEWILCEEKLPEEYKEVLCYCPGIGGHMRGLYWMDSDYCLGSHLDGNWKRCDNENINVELWFEFPKPPEFDWNEWERRLKSEGIEDK